MSITYDMKNDLKCFERKFSFHQKHKYNSIKNDFLYLFIYSFHCSGIKFYSTKKSVFLVSPQDEGRCFHNIVLKTNQWIRVKLLIILILRLTFVSEANWDQEAFCDIPYKKIQKAPPESPFLTCCIGDCKSPVTKVSLLLWSIRS
jgi:hypothetical protein